MGVKKLASGPTRYVYPTLRYPRSRTTAQTDAAL